MNSAGRLSIQRRPQVPLQRTIFSQNNATVATNHETHILDMKRAAELLHFTPSFLSKSSTARWPEHRQFLIYGLVAADDSDARAC